MKTARSTVASARAVSPSLAPVLVLVLAPVLALASCGTTGRALAESDAHYRLADYYQAYYVLARAREENPDDPEIEKRFWEVRIAYLLKRAQRHVFKNQEEEAVADLEQVLVWDPGNKIAESWMNKAKTKLALRWTAEGDDLRVAGDLEEAVRLYHRALTCQPGNPDAEEGLRLLAETWQARRDKAQDHYLDGVRALAEQLFKQTKYHMLIAVDQDPSLTDAHDRAHTAGLRLAEYRFERAKATEESGYYEPALKEYEAIAGEWPDYPGIHERIEHMKKECEALRLAREGEVEVFRANFGKARELLEKAFDISVSQRATIGGMLIQIKDRELDVMYRKARDLEIQNMLEGALAGYVTIDETLPDGFKDVKARINQLQVTIESAAEAYAGGQAAEQSGDLDNAIEHYRDAQLFYPGYRDVESRIGELESRRAGSNPKQGGEANTGEPAKNPTEAPAENPSGKKAEETAEQSTAETAEKSAAETAEKAAGEPVENREKTDPGAAGKQG